MNVVEFRRMNSPTGFPFSSWAFLKRKGRPHWKQNSWLIVFYECLVPESKRSFDQFGDCELSIQAECRVLSCSLPVFDPSSHQLSRFQFVCQFFAEIHWVMSKFLPMWKINIALPFTCALLRNIWTSALSLEHSSLWSLKFTRESPNLDIQYAHVATSFRTKINKRFIC